MTFGHYVESIWNKPFLEHAEFFRLSFWEWAWIYFQSRLFSVGGASALTITSRCDAKKNEQRFCALSFIQKYWTWSDVWVMRHVRISWRMRFGIPNIEMIFALTMNYKKKTKENRMCSSPLGVIRHERETHDRQYTHTILCFNRATDDKFHGDFHMSHTCPCVSITPIKGEKKFKSDQIKRVYIK